MRTLLTGFLLISLVGCGNMFEMDPGTTVILKVTGVADTEEGDDIREQAVELVQERSSWQKNQMSQHGETLMIKLSPVADAQEFADRINFATVTSIEGNIIHLKTLNP